MPGAVTLGALKSPWVLQPVFAGFSILSPSWLWIDIPTLVVLVGLFTWAVAGRRMLRVRRVPAWCSATIGVEGPDSYTAFGYADPTRRVLANVLHTRSEVRVLTAERDAAPADEMGGALEADGGPDVARAVAGPGGGAEPVGGAEEPGAAAGGPHLGYTSDVIEVVETYLYRPAFRLVAVIVAAVKRLQSGRLDAYLLYMLIALIAVIAAVTALA